VVCVLGMMFIYKSLERSMEVLVLSLHEMIKYQWRENAPRVQGMAENTEVVE
jgi:hypothetical protein